MPSGKYKAYKDLHILFSGLIWMKTGLFTMIVILCAWPETLPVLGLLLHAVGGGEPRCLRDLKVILKQIHNGSGMAIILYDLELPVQTFYTRHWAYETMWHCWSQNAIGLCLCLNDCMDVKASVACIFTQHPVICLSSQVCLWNAFG